MFPLFTLLSLLAIFTILHKMQAEFGGSTLLITYISVVLKLVVGLANNTFGPLPGADVDAVNFEATGLQLAAAWEWTGIKFLPFTARYAYSNFLGLLFYVDGYNVLLVPLVNTAFTTFAAYNILLAAKILGFDRRKIFLIAVVLAINPIILLYSAVPMREAPIYAVIALFFRVLMSQPRRPSVITNPTLLISIAVAIYLHIGLAALALILLAWAADVTISIKAIARPLNALVFVFLAVVLAFLLNTDFIQSIPRVARLLDSATGSISFESLASAQEAKSRGEGAYVYPENIIGIPVIDQAFAAFYMTIRLIFSPFLWEISGASGATLIKLGDLALQLALHFMAIRSLRTRDGHDPMAFLYAGYLLLCLIFGLNTVNDGVALRHRTKFVWVLVLVAFSLRKRQRRRTNHVVTGGQWPKS
ncbi:MAG: hypothetical protein ABJ239_04845 [Erythrobacter sp.]